MPDCTAKFASDVFYTSPGGEFGAVLRIDCLFNSVFSIDSFRDGMYLVSESIFETLYLTLAQVKFVTDMTGYAPAGTLVFL